MTKILQRIVNKIKIGFHYLRWLMIFINKCLIYFIPKDNRLILISAWFGQKYADSCMYEYEYLLNNSCYKVFWFTRSEAVYTYLHNKNYPVVKDNTLKGIWMQIRAKVLVSSIQTSDFNCMYLNRQILLDLDHGFAIKQVGLAIPDTPKRWKTFQKLLRWGLDYRMTASSKFCCNVISECYEINPEKIVFVNKPRIDVLFDDTLRKGKNGIVEEAKNGRLAFVWMPTHRSCGEVKIDTENILNLDKLQEVCERNNVIFIIKKHYYHRKEVLNTDNYPNIFDFTDAELDVQTLIAQADVLISDYSASYIDFLCLDRPILLYQYDYEEYLKSERGLYIPPDQNKAGEIIKDQESLYKSIERISKDPYDKQFSEGRSQERLRFFDKNVEIGSSRKRVQQIIEELIDGNYHYNWE